MNATPEFKPLLLKGLHKPPFQPENFPTTLASNFSLLPSIPGQSVWDFQPRLSHPTMVSEIQDFYSHWDLSRKLFPSVDNIDVETVKLLTSSDYKTRLDSARKVLSFSQGLLKPETRENLDPEEARLVILQRTQAQLKAIKLNNQRLLNLDTFSFSYKSLKALVETINILGEGVIRDGVMLEISLHLSILYMMMVSCEPVNVVSSIIGQSPYPPLFFFSVLDKLSDGNMKEFPVRKLALVLAKCVSLIVGDDKKIEELKLATNPRFTVNSKGKAENKKEADAVGDGKNRNLKNDVSDSLESLSFSNLSIEFENEGHWQADNATGESILSESALDPRQPKALKTSLQEYSDHRNLIMHRYPSYYLPDAQLGIDLPAPSSQLGRQLSEFYTLNSPLDSSFSVQSYLEASRYAVFDPPLMDETEPNSSVVELPKSLLEAESLFQKYLWESRAYTQLEVARSYAKKAEIWSFLKEVNCPIPENVLPVDVENAEGLDQINQLYTSLESNLSQYITMLVRLLFYLNISPSSESLSASHTLNNLFTLSESERAEEVINRDALRHKEIITHYISQILFDITRSAKRHRKNLLTLDILAFENVCILMVDNNAPILILKMLSSWFSNPNSSKLKKNTNLPDDIGDIEDTSIGTAWLQDRPLIDELNFFHVCNNIVVGNQSFPQQKQFILDDDLSKKISSVRNFKTTINLLRLLQKISKNKINRILSMVQWKANAVLKRILKVPNQPLHIYALKLLKSQIPYLGKKWRGNNMHVISAIYMNLRHRLKEEYLSGDFDADPAEASRKDEELRQMVSNFNLRRRQQLFLEAGKTIRGETKLDISTEFDSLVGVDSSQEDDNLDFFKPLSNLDFHEEDSLVLSLDSTDYDSENDVNWDENWTDGTK